MAELASIARRTRAAHDSSVHNSETNFASEMCKKVSSDLAVIRGVAQRPSNLGGEV